MDAVVDAADEALIRSRNAAALVRRYYGPVLSLTQRLLGNPSDARDATQETFARALAHLRDFEPERSFRAWVFSIAANHVRDLLRRRKQLTLHPGIEDSLPASTTPEERLLRGEDRERLLAAVDRLPFDLRIVVTLVFQQELPYSEIAAALGVTVNAVRIRLYRALTALRKDFL